MADVGDDTETRPAGRFAVASFIDAHREEILHGWADNVRRHVSAADGLATPVLRDHMPDLLGELAEFLRAEQPGSEAAPLSDNPASHALHRLDVGFDLEHVATEYRLLRRAIVDVFIRHGVAALDVEGMALVHDAIDEAVTHSVQQFIRARGRTLSALDQLSQLALGAPESRALGELLPKLLEVVVGTTAAVDCAAILFVEGDVLRVQAAVGSGSEGSVRRTVRMGEGVAGIVARRREPLMVRDGEHDPRITQSGVVFPGTRAVFGVPLLHGETLIGVAVLASHTAYEFSDEDLFLMRTMAQRATSIIVQAQLRAAADESRALLRSIVEQMPAAVFVAEAPSGRIILGNRRIAELFRQPFHAAESVENYTRYRGFHPDGRPLTPQEWPLARSARHGEVIHDEEVIIERGDGTRGWFLCSGAPIRDEAGQVTFAVVALSDVTELKRAYGELERRAAQLEHAHSVLEHGQSVLVLDRDFRITFANRQLELLIGRPRSGLIGRSWAEVGPEVCGAEISGEYQRAMRERVEAHFEEFYAPLRRWTAVSAYPLDDGGMAVFFHDISDRKRAELNVKESEERFREIANALPQIIWTATGDFHVDWYNDWWFKYLGLPRGTRWDDADTQPMHPDDVQRTRQALKEAVASGKDFVMEQRFRRGSDGQYRWHLVRGVPIRDAEGKIAKWIGANTDIHDHREATRALEESRQRLSLVVESAHLGTFEYDVRSRAVQLNAIAQEFFGFEHGATAHELAQVVARIHDEDRRRLLDTLARAQQDTSAGGYFEQEFRTWGAHRERWFAFRGRVLFDAERKPLRAIGVMIDITEPKMEEEVRERFLGIVSHDLRSPLTAIRASVALLNRAEDLPEKFRRSIHRVGGAADRMSRMISDLLDFTRGRLGTGIPVHRAAMNLRQLAELVLEETRFAHPQKELRLEATGRFEGDWDEDRLTQLLSNLLDNAVRYGAEDAPISVRLDGTAADSVVLRVHNRGNPIPEALVESIFEPFRRGATGEREGLGLGLYIARLIVEAHQGEISVTSDATSGTEFVVVLPRHPRTQPH